MYKKLLFLFLSVPTSLASGQMGTTPEMHGAEIQHAIKKLKTLGSVLYIAAHPDDENTRMIAYLTNGLHYRTGYLSLTRGDGGQNLLGKEVYEELGVIRTQELLAARRLDQGQQFFTRANDFGYSKSLDETLQIWDKKLVLADVVLSIRRFKPDVVITRFSPDPMRTHGHHTASAMIALEAFKAAGDPAMFPEQLTEVAVWKPKRIFWNTSWWFSRETGFDNNDLIKMDVGGYNTLLGKSYSEIASASRSMHKSQGFGAAMQRGENLEYLQFLDGDPIGDDMMEGIDTDWSRLPNGEAVVNLIDQIYHSFDVEKPERSIENLLDLHRMIRDYLPSQWADIKIKELETIILQCAGIWAEATIDKYSATAGDSVMLKVCVIKRMDVPVTLEKIKFPHMKMDSAWALPFNQMMEQSIPYQIPEKAEVSQPYWLQEKSTQGMFSINDLHLIGRPENEPVLSTTFYFSFGVTEKELIRVKLPVYYRWVEPTGGEKYRPFQVAPKVTVNLDRHVYVVFGKRDVKITVTVKSHSTNVSGTVSFDIGNDWTVEDNRLEFSFDKPYQEKRFNLTVMPPVKSGEAVISAKVSIDGKISDALSLTEINYPHIPVQTLFPQLEAKLVKLEINTMGRKIGYVEGAGDAIPEALLALEYKVVTLDDQMMTVDALEGFDAIILGIRALNTNEKISNWMPVLLDYTRAGGHVVVQYNTSHRLKTTDFAPFPIKLSRNRVTREDAAVKILAKNHLILQKPNRISNSDFDNWVQERGLYFPIKWDDQYTPILSSRDPKEADLEGGILVCDYGSGSFVHTSYSWFRQLPAGVPGAYKIFVNLISYGEVKRSANR